MHARHLAPILTIIPTTAVFGAYAINIHYGDVGACIPFIEGCHSISSTARNGPGLFLFRPLLTVDAVLLCIFWLMVGHTLQSLNASQALRRWTSALGFIGAAILVLYVTFLGEKHPVYDVLRRFGISMHFGLTALAQLLVVYALSKNKGRQPATVNKVYKIQLGMLLLMLCLGIANSIGKYILEDSHRFGNVIEWNFALLMYFYFLTYYPIWQHYPLRVILQNESPGT